MRITNLDLINFRNLLSQSVSFSEKVTVLTGKNGQGKTSLLESIYILSQAKSFRSSKPSELRNWEASKDDLCSITGLVYSDGEGEKKVSYRVVHGRREVLINDTKVKSSSDFYGTLKCVEFTPDDLNLISGSPSLRRKFFDRLIAQTNPVYLKSLVDYHRALKQRNSLLYSGIAADNELFPWEVILAQRSLVIASERMKMMKEYRDFFSNLYSFFTGYQQKEDTIEKAEIHYKSEVYNEEGCLLDEESILEKFRLSRGKDIARKSTSKGVHRDEFLINLDPGAGFKLARNFASQGQKRSLSLSLKFAAISYIEMISGESPLLLLDDVESELDRYRKQALFWKIREIPSQVIITATELSEENSKALSGPEVMKIERGQITVI